jgi:hypothetical protein
VRARSCAEIPVETPSRASIDTVKAVPERRLVVVRHRTQLELVAALGCQAEADEPTAVGGHERDRLGVTNCAAAVRSPSFSRSASSTTTTKRPERMSSIASSIVANGEAGVRRGQIRGHARIVALSGKSTVRRTSRGHRLRGSLVAPGEVGERRRLERVRHERDGERALGELGDRE